jgi:hypothetical protein
MRRGRGNGMQRFLNPTLIVSCVVLSAFLFVNLALLMSSIAHPKEPPRFIGFSPLIISDTDASLDVMKNDLIIVKHTASAVAGDLLSYKVGTDYVVTNKIVDIEDDAYIVDEAGEVVTVEKERTIGSVVAKIGWLGRFMVFTQSMWGLIIFVGLPALVLIIYEVVTD